MKLQEIVSINHTQAAIFDLDGTLVDNNEYHLASWRKYLEEKSISISEENYRQYINGRTNKDAIEYIYQRKMSDNEAMLYALEKEAVYRKLYAPYIQPVNGLLDLLNTLSKTKIKIGMATSGIPVNIDFLFQHIPIQSYFSTIVHSQHITKGKPDPEIYIKAAAALNTKPSNCIAFEDAAVGVASAKAAGIFTIALLTTQTREELSQADLIIQDFTVLNQ
jgi:beta-phosphoglucomutase